MDKKLREHILSQDYDKEYQDVEVAGIEGYSKSHITWDNIYKFNIEWQDKVVCDLGCFHGYFAIKIKNAGASKVYGLDRREDVLNTSKRIAKASDTDIEFLRWEGGEPTPKCDIALVLNMLHHTKDPKTTLENIDCTHALLEVYENQLNTVEKCFDLIKTLPSHRKERVMLYGKKK